MTSQSVSPVPVCGVPVLAGVLLVNGLGLALLHRLLVLTLRLALLTALLSDVVKHLVEVFLF